MQRAMRLTLSVVLFIAACNRTKPTQPGTELARWDKTLESEPEVLAAKELSPRKSTDVKLVAKAKVKGPVTLNVHFETAPIEIVWKDGTTERPPAPVAARIVVDANDDWSLSSGCEEGLHRKLGRADPMIKSCHVSMSRVDGTLDAHVGFSVEMAGDGTVHADGVDFSFTME
jgi:hypothetical protein